ncbi:hypothetical protein BgiMline_018760, partial [Biomphalaria glabrata]
VRRLMTNVFTSTSERMPLQTFQTLHKQLNGLVTMIGSIHSHLEYISQLEWLDWPVAEETESQGGGGQDTWTWLSTMTGGHAGVVTLVLSSVVTLMLLTLLTLFLYRRHYGKQTEAKLQVELVTEVSACVVVEQCQGSESKPEKDSETDDVIKIDIKHEPIKSPELFECMDTDCVAADAVNVSTNAEVAVAHRQDTCSSNVALFPGPCTAETTKILHIPVYTTASSPKVARPLKKNQKNRNRVNRSTSYKKFRNSGKRETFRDPKKTYMIVMMKTPLPGQGFPPAVRPSDLPLTGKCFKFNEDLTAAALARLEHAGNQKAPEKPNCPTIEVIQSDDCPKVADDREINMTSCNTILHGQEGRTKLKRIRNSLDAKKKATRPKGRSKKGRLNNCTSTIFRMKRKALTRENTFLVDNSLLDRTYQFPPKKMTNKQLETRYKKSKLPLSDISTDHICKNFNLKKTETPVLNSLKGEGAFECYSKNSQSMSRDSPGPSVKSIAEKGRVKNDLGLRRNNSEETDSFDISPKRYRYDTFKSFQESVSLGYNVLGNIGRHNTKFLAERGQTSSNDLSSINDDAMSHLPDFFSKPAARNFDGVYSNRDFQKSFENVDMANCKYVSHGNANFTRPVIEDRFPKVNNLNKNTCTITVEKEQKNIFEESCFNHTLKDSPNNCQTKLDKPFFKNQFGFIEENLALVKPGNRQSSHKTIQPTAVQNEAKINVKTFNRGSMKAFSNEKKQTHPSENQNDKKIPTVHLNQFSFAELAKQAEAKQINPVPQQLIPQLSEITMDAKPLIVFYNEQNPSRREDHGFCNHPEANKRVLGKKQGLPIYVKTIKKPMTNTTSEEHHRMDRDSHTCYDCHRERKQKQFIFVENHLTCDNFQSGLKCDAKFTDQEQHFYYEAGNTFHSVRNSGEDTLLWHSNAKENTSVDNHHLHQDSHRYSGACTPYDNNISAITSRCNVRRLPEHLPSSGHAASRIYKDNLLRTAVIQGDNIHPNVGPQNVTQSLNTVKPSIFHPERKDNGSENEQEHFRGKPPSERYESNTRQRKYLDVLQRNKDADQYRREKTKMKRQKCNHLVKKSKSLISVGNMLSHLAAKPTKFSDQQEECVQVLKPNKWICQYREPANAAPDLKTFDDLNQRPRQLEHVKNKYIKCSKSKKTKSHRHEPYRKHSFVSTDSTPSGHCITYRNRNNCSPSRRGRFVTAPKVDPQFFHTEQSPKQCRKDTTTKTLESEQWLLVEPDDIANQRSKSSSDICQGEISESMENEQNKNVNKVDSKRSKSCVSRTVRTPEKCLNNNIALEEHSFKKGDTIVKPSETLGTLNKSNTQSSSNTLASYSNPSHILLSSQQPTNSMTSEPVLSKSWAGEELPSTESRAEDESLTSMTKPTLKTAVQQSMTQSHTTQTDATFLTASVDVQTSPLYDNRPTGNYFPVINVGVQTSPLLGNKKTCHSKRKGFSQTPKSLRDKSKAMKMNKLMRLKYAYKSNPINGEMIVTKDFLSRQPQINQLSQQTPSTDQQQKETFLATFGAICQSAVTKSPPGKIQAKSLLYNKLGQKKDEISSDHLALGSSADITWSSNSTNGNTQVSSERKEIFLFRGLNSDLFSSQISSLADQGNSSPAKGTEPSVVLVASAPQQDDSAHNIAFPSTSVLKHVEAVSETSTESSSKLSELKSLCLVRPSWKNANVEEIDRRVKRALRLREELHKQRSMAMEAEIKRKDSQEQEKKITPKVPKTKDKVEDQNKVPVHNASTNILHIDMFHSSSKQAESVKPSDNNSLVGLDKKSVKNSTNQEHSSNLQNRAPKTSKKVPNEGKMLICAEQKCSLQDDNDSDGNDTNALPIKPYNENVVNETDASLVKPYNENVIVSTQTSFSNIELNTLKRARVKDKNSPPTKISKVENALTKPVVHIGELVSCLPQVPLASFVEWFIETSDPNSYVSSDHSSNSSGKDREEKVTSNEVNASESEDLSCYVHYRGKTNKLHPVPSFNTQETPPSAFQFTTATNSASENEALVSHFNSKMVTESRDSNRLAQQWDQKRNEDQHATDRHCSDVSVDPDEGQCFHRHYPEVHFSRNQKENAVEELSTPDWCSRDGGDSVVISEISASASGTTVTQIDNSSCTVQTPTAQLAYENYSDDLSPSFTGDIETASSVDTCTADLSVFLDGYGNSFSTKGNREIISGEENKEWAAGAVTHAKFKEQTSCEMINKRMEEEKLSGPGKGHIFMNFRKTTDSHELSRYDRTRIRLLKSSDVTGIITKVQKGD